MLCVKFHALLALVFCLLQVDGYAFSFVFACTVGNCVCQNLACFQASFDVFCMRWDVRNIILEVQTMGSESLQACKHSKFHL